MLAKLTDVVYRVQLVRGCKVVLHRDRLAPYQPPVPMRDQLELSQPLVWKLRLLWYLSTQCHQGASNAFQCSPRHLYWVHGLLGST